jgi:hypothetical protein
LLTTPFELLQNHLTRVQRERRDATPQKWDLDAERPRDHPETTGPPRDHEIPETHKSAATTRKQQKRPQHVSLSVRGPRDHEIPETTERTPEHVEMPQVPLDKFEEFAAAMNRDERSEGDEGENPRRTPSGELGVDGNGNDRTMWERILQEQAEQTRRLVLDVLERTERSTRSQSSRESEAEATRSYHVVPDFSKSIRAFSGENLSDSQTWLKGLSATAALHHWPDEYKLEAARTSLRGPAREWYEGRIDTIRTWADFEDAFRRTFVHETTHTQRWKAMTARIQGAKESVHAYFLEKAKLCRQLHLPFHEQKEQIVVGMHSRELAAMLMSKGHYDEDDLFRDVVAFERITAERRDRHKGERAIVQQTRSPQETRSTKANDKPGTDSGDQNKRLPSRDQQGRPLCYSCKEYGHVARHCGAPQQREHTATQKRPREDQAGATVNVIVAETTGKRYCKDVVLDGRYVVQGFVDTGSAICSIQKSAVKKFRMKEVPEAQALYAFGDTTKPVMHAKSKVLASIAIDGVKVGPLELITVPDEAQDTELIIGRPFCDDDRVAYIKKGGDLMFGYAREAPFSDWDVEAIVGSSGARMTESVTVPPLSVVETITTSSYGQNKVMRIYNACNQPITCEPDQPVEATTTKEELCLPVDKIPEMSIQCGSEIPPEQRTRIYQLVDTFRDCFALRLEELGCTDMVQMDITDNDVPVRSLPYKCSAKDRQTIAEIVADLKRCGIVSETNSPYASPVLLVRKKNGDPRLVVDYHKLNRQTVHINYPMPEVDEQFKHLCGAKMFATLDWANGYMQVPLTSKAKAKTAFITPDTTGEFNRMVFGLAGAPFEFVRHMNVVLGPLRIQAQIELRAPQCLNSQRQLKNEEIAYTRCDTTLKTAVKAYERTSQPSARDARTAIREEEIEEAQGSNELLQDRTLKSQLTTEELTAANEKPERSEKNAAAKIERTKIDPETQMQKVTELKKENGDKKLIEEEQVAERQVRARETQVPSLSRELNEPNIKVEELERTRRRLQAERDELLEKVNNSISKEGLLTDTKRRLEARATVKWKKHQKLKAECKRRQKHREFLTSTLQHGSINHAVCRIRSQRQFPSMRHHDRRHIAGCLLRVHTKPPRGKQAGGRHPISQTSRPTQRRHIVNRVPVQKKKKKRVTVLVRECRTKQSTRVRVMRYPHKHQRPPEDLSASGDLRPSYLTV